MVPGDIVVHISELQWEKFFMSFEVIQKYIIDIAYH